MSLFTRLTHPVGNEQKIPSHQFMAALAELGRGEFTRVEARTILHLAWNPNPGAIDGYIIYFGPSADTASTQVSEISLTAPGFDPLAPAVKYAAAPPGFPASWPVRHVHFPCVGLRASGSQIQSAPTPERLTTSG